MLAVPRMLLRSTIQSPWAMRAGEITPWAASQEVHPAAPGSQRRTASRRVLRDSAEGHSEERYVADRVNEPSTAARTSGTMAKGQPNR
jgi:hypothetical protein